MDKDDGIKITITIHRSAMSEISGTLDTLEACANAAATSRGRLARARSQNALRLTLRRFRRQMQGMAPGVF